MSPARSRKKGLKSNYKIENAFLLTQFNHHPINQNPAVDLYITLSHPWNIIYHVPLRNTKPIFKEKFSK